MQLVGVYNSPYVRRVAVSLHLLGVPFERQAHRVFADMEAFGRINPVLRAPSLVCDDGTVLLDSTLILDWVEQCAGRSLLPQGPTRIRTLRLIGLGLAACDAAVQVYYEHVHRPEERRHTPWIERRERQAHAALSALEAEAGDGPWLQDNGPNQADVTVAVAWRFIQDTRPDLALPGHHPKLVALSKRAEALPEFVAAPPG